MPVHLIIIHLSLFISEVPRISQKICVSIIKIRSSYLEIIISFKSFNSTGAIPPFNQSFNDVSFEWALTHRSFPRILRDSSNYHRTIPEFFSKFDVRMNFHQSDVFFKINFNSFHCWFTLSTFHSSGVSQQFWWCFSSSFEDRSRVFP